MKKVKYLIFVLVILLCAGCSTVTSEPKSQSFEDLVNRACFEVQLGLDKEGIDNKARDIYWLEAATQFRNLSNQNQAFTDYASALNSWATGGGYWKIREVFEFCGTT